MKQKKYLTIMLGLSVVLASTAPAQVVIYFGNNNDPTAEIPGASGNFGEAAVTAAMAGTSEASAYTIGTFSALPSGNPGSGVSFDIEAKSGGEFATFRAQPAGLGIPGGSVNSTIDNDGGAALEWMSLELQNISGLGAGDELVFTSISILYATSPGETYRLDIGSTGSAPSASDALFSGDDLAIGDSAFTFGAGSGGDTKFVLESVTIDVIEGLAAIPEPASLGLLMAASVFLFSISRRRRRQ